MCVPCMCLQVPENVEAELIPEAQGGEAGRDGLSTPRALLGSQASSRSISPGAQGTGAYRGRPAPLRGTVPVTEEEERAAEALLRGRSRGFVRPQTQASGEASLAQISTPPGEHAAEEQEQAEQQAEEGQGYGTQDGAGSAAEGVEEGEGNGQEAEGASQAEMEAAALALPPALPPPRLTPNSSFSSSTIAARAEFAAMAAVGAEDAQGEARSRPASALPAPMPPPSLAPGSRPASASVTATAAAVAAPGAEAHPAAGTGVVAPGEAAGARPGSGGKAASGGGAEVGSAAAPTQEPQPAPGPAEGTVAAAGEPGPGSQLSKEASVANTAMASLREFEQVAASEGRRRQTGSHQYELQGGPAGSDQLPESLLPSSQLPVPSTGFAAATPGASAGSRRRMLQGMQQGRYDRHVFKERVARVNAEALASDGAMLRAWQQSVRYLIDLQVGRMGCACG